MERFVSSSCVGEVCSLCGAPATHKVGEEIAHDDPAWQRVLGHTILTRHNYTAYVCCEHFRAIFGNAVTC
jgi:hypothetical protein